FVDSTPVGSNLDLYGGDQTPTLNHIDTTINIRSTGGVAVIEGGGGSDLISVNYDLLGNQTFIDGISAPLSLQGGQGSDVYQIGLSGQPGQPITVADVVNPGDLNQLAIYGANQPEYYLLRANL